MFKTDLKNYSARKMLTVECTTCPRKKLRLGLGLRVNFFGFILKCLREWNIRQASSKKKCQRHSKHDSDKWARF